MGTQFKLEWDGNSSGTNWVEAFPTFEVRNGNLNASMHAIPGINIYSLPVGNNIYPSKWEHNLEWNGNSRGRPCSTMHQYQYPDRGDT